MIFVCLQFAVVLNDKKAKIRHLKAQCMQKFMIYCMFLSNDAVETLMSVLMLFVVMQAGGDVH